PWRPAPSESDTCSTDSRTTRTWAISSTSCSRFGRSTVPCDARPGPGPRARRCRCSARSWSSLGLLQRSGAAQLHTDRVVLGSLFDRDVVRTLEHRAAHEFLALGVHFKGHLFAQLLESFLRGCARVHVPRLQRS